MLWTTKVPKLIKGYVSEFGINHWTEEYIIKTAGDYMNNMSHDGRPAKGDFIRDTYKKFFEYYKNKGYYSFTRHVHQFGVQQSRIEWGGIIYDAPRQSSETPPFINDIKIPKEVSTLKLELSQAVFFVGNKGTGAMPHIHPAAINLLVSGSKSWTLFDTTTSTGLELQQYYNSKYGVKPTSTDWLEEEYNTSLQDYKDSGGKVYEFIQEAGDVVFIPAKWSHTIINLDECLGVILGEKHNEEFKKTETSRCSGKCTTK